MPATQLRPGLFRFDDICNVYLLVRGDFSIAIDFGSGRWMDELPALGLPPVRHVFLTHHHADQCEGLLERGKDWSFTLHAPVGEQAFLGLKEVSTFWQTRRDRGNPPSYAVPPRGLFMDVQYDMAGFGDVFVGNERIRSLHTPGHGPNALSIIVDQGGEQVVFCGDAAHAGATIWQPFHLEWDHWTGGGTLAAWEGIERLRNVHIDLLCPSHGPVIDANPRQLLTTLAARLLDLYRAKGSICPDESDCYLTPERLKCGAARILPGLTIAGTNTWVLTSSNGEALVIDPYAAEIPPLESLLEELGRPKVTACTATHFHLDHSDGLPVLKEKYGATVWLHPQVAAPLAPLAGLDVPWLPKDPIIPDKVLPTQGTWKWNEFEFRVAPFPGQTWWHCCLMTTIAGKKVFFGGDNFQANSRWNGTGGFSSFNGSRFREGFVRSAQLVLDWKPDIFANGHQEYFRFQASHFEKIIKWAGEAEAAVKALCPTGDLEKDYYLHHLG